MVVLEGQRRDEDKEAAVSRTRGQVGYPLHLHTFP